MCFFFTKWKRPIKVRMYDFIHIYIFSLYSFLGQSKTQITCDFESLAAATHVGLLNTSTTPHKTTSTRPEILFCHWFCVSLAKKLAESILRVVFHQISTFSLGGSRISWADLSWTWKQHCGKRHLFWLVVIVFTGMRVNEIKCSMRNNITATWVPCTPATAKHWWSHHLALQLGLVALSQDNHLLGAQLHHALHPNLGEQQH